jgi:hypothetical protein
MPRMWTTMVLSPSRTPFSFSRSFSVGGYRLQRPSRGAARIPLRDGLSCEVFQECGKYTFTFYGQEVSGDAVFFVIDRSFHMLETGELQRAKMQVQRALSDMPDGTRFAVLFFDAGMRRGTMSRYGQERVQDPGG